MPCGVNGPSTLVGVRTDAVGLVEMPCDVNGPRTFVGVPVAADITLASVGEVSAPLLSG